MISTEKQNIEKQIEELYIFKANGAKIRSRSEFLENDEKNCKLFLGLEKSRQARKIIHSLNDNGQIFKTENDILQQETIFYETLYSSEIIDVSLIDDYLENTNIEYKLNNTEASVCDGLLKYDEGRLAIIEMKPNKSPGLDGLTVEFYQKFWSKIGTLVINSLNEAYINKELSVSQKQGVLSLLFKKGDPENIENWRPITLLNIDYKIATRILAKRVQNILPKIINMDQQGYIKNRFIGYNIRQIQDIIDYSEQLNIDGALLFLDFKKAFDTVKLPFYFQLLNNLVSMIVLLLGLKLYIIIVLLVL